MENQSKLIQNVTTIVKNINQVDLKGQIDRLFQGSDLHAKFKQNSLINWQLIQKLSKYILLREQNAKNNGLGQSQLIRLHYEIRQSVTYFQFVRNSQGKTSSQYFLYNIITLIELTAHLLQRYACKPPTAFPCQELFITVVYIVTNKLVSQKCYFLLRHKMRKPEEPRISSKLFKSRKKPKIDPITVDKIHKSEDLLADFAYSLKTSLYKHKSDPSSITFQKGAIKHYSPLLKRPKTPQIYPKSSQTQNLSLQNVSHSKKHRISLQSKLIIKQSIKYMETPGRGNRKYTYSNSLSTVSIEDKITHIILNHKNLTCLKLV